MTIAFISGATALTAKPFPPATLVQRVRETLDLSRREVLAVAPVLVMIFWIGLYPKPFLDRIEPTAQLLLSRLKAARATRYLAEEPAGRERAAQQVAWWSSQAR